MILSNRNYNNPIFLINIVFAFFPISFIFGNLITNINLLLFCGIGIYLLKSKLLLVKFDIALKAIFLFFVIIFLSTAFYFIKFLYLEGAIGDLVITTLSAPPQHDKKNLERLIKSILFFRFFIMLLIVYLLIKFEFLNLKYFFISAALVPFLISMDLIQQYTVGYNVIGLESHGHHNSSFFGDELIAGGFIKNFSFFTILFLSYVLRNNNNYIKYIFFPVVICTLAMGILASGNRMPLILFLLGLFTILIFNQKLKKIAFPCLLFTVIFLGFIFSINGQIKKNYSSFYDNSKKIIVTSFKSVKNQTSKVNLEKNTNLANKDLENIGHKKIWLTAIETWKLHKIIGNGMKSFREDCKKIINVQKKGICSNHPHNYYLEILTDLGIIGFLSAIGIAIIFIIFLIKNYKFLKVNNLGSLFLSAAIISFFVEVFPIRSTGSIFTTSNATYIILMAGIILSYKKLIKD